MTPPAAFDDVTGRNVNSTNALTVVQQTIAPAAYPRSGRSIPAIPANDFVPRHSQNRHHTRHPSIDSEEIEQAGKRRDNEAASLRDRRKPGEQQPRRREADYRQAPRQQSATAFATSEFVAQFIAQEIVPGSPDRAGGVGRSGIQAYETTIDRIELYTDPFQSVNLRT